MIIVALSMTVGCAGNVTHDAQPPSSPRPSTSGAVKAEPHVDLSSLRSWDGDYVHYKSPEALAVRSSVVLAGEIEAVVDGPTYAYPPDERERFAVVHVRVDSVIKADGAADIGETAYVLLSRGVEVVDTAGEPVAGSGVPLTVSSVRTVSQALTLGTRVVVLSNPVQPPVEAATRVMDADAGRPPGATLLSGGHPQRFLVVNSDGEVSGWNGLTYESLLTRLEQQD